MNISKNIVKSSFFCNKFLLTIVLLLSIIESFCVVFFSFVIEKIINMGIAGESIINLLLFAIISVVLFVTFFFLFNFTFNIYAESASKRLRFNLFNLYFSSRPSVFTTRDNEYYVSKIVNDARIISNNYYCNLILFIRSLSKIILGLAYAFYVHYAIAILFIVFSLTLFIVVLLFPKKLSKKRNEQVNASEKYIGALTKAFSVHNSAYYFDSNNFVKNKTDELNNYLREKETKISIFSTFINSTATFITIFVQMTSIIFSIMLYSKGIIELGALTSVLVLSSYILNPASELSIIITSIFGCKKIIQSIKLDTYKYGVEAVENPKLLKNIQEICVNNATFLFENGSGFNKLNITIQKNKKVLILGNSGSGKTTFLKLLAGIYECDNNCKIIFQNGESEVISSSNLISYCEQNPAIFDASVEANITFSSEIDNERLKKSMIKSRLCFEEDNYLDCLKKLNDSNLLSGGEIKRIGLARMFYKDSEIMIFDEPATSLDKNNEKIVYENILDLKNKIIVCVAHKPPISIASKFDKVYRLDDFKLTEIDNLDDVSDLIENDN